MKKLIVLSLVTIVLLSACTSGTNNTAPSPTLTNAPAPGGTSEPVSSPENTPEPERRFVSVEYSTSFSVEYITDDVLLVSDAENQRFLLVPRGQEAPAGHEDALIVYTPVERVLFSSSTQFGMLVPFDIWNNMGGLVSNPTDWPFPELNERIADGSIVYVGNSMGSELDYELIQELNPELSFVYSGPSAQTDLMLKLDELGLPYAVDNEYMEATHQGRMEWIKFLAPFFGKTGEAVEYVDAMFGRLADMESRIEGADKPKVAWGRVDGGVARVVGADSYVAKMLDSVGCEYLFSHIEGNGTVQISTEEFYDAVMDADIWIYSVTPTSMSGYDALLEIQPIMADVPCVINKQVWQIGVNYYSFTAEIDYQVIELASIIHPELFPEVENLRQFQKMAG